MPLKWLSRDCKRSTTQRHKNTKRDLDAHADNTSSPSFYKVITAENYIIQYYPNPNRPFTDYPADKVCVAEGIYLEFRRFSYYLLENAT